MEVFPAVDVLRGMCVQLVQGERSSATVYGSPRENADRWIRSGARNLHVVNLDGAFAVSGWQETAGDYIRVGTAV